MSNIDQAQLSAGWYGDPFGRAVQRYWNGVAWTPYVVDSNGQQRTEVDEQAAPAPSTLSAQGQGIVIQNIVQQTAAAPPMMVVGSMVEMKNMATAVLLSFFFGPLGLFYASVMGGAILTALTVLTLGVGIVVTWPVAIVWSIIAVNQHNQRLAGALSGPQPIYAHGPRTSSLSSTPGYAPAPGGGQGPWGQLPPPPR